jgi:hypothetical protein
MNLAIKMNVSNDTMYFLTRAINTTMQPEEILVTRFDNKIFLQKITCFDIYLNFLRPTLEILLDQKDHQTIDILKKDFLEKFNEDKLEIFNKLITIIQLNNFRPFLEKLYRDEEYSSIEIMRDRFKKEKILFDQLLKEVRSDIQNKEKIQAPPLLPTHC